MTEEQQLVKGLGKTSVIDSRGDYSYVNLPLKIASLLIPVFSHMFLGWAHHGKNLAEKHTFPQYGLVLRALQNSTGLKGSCYNCNGI